MSKIYAAISAVMAEIGSIGKDRKNQGQGYNFRGIDEVYNTIHPLLIKHKIFTVPQILEHTREERASKNGGALFCSFIKMEYTLFAEDGSHIKATVIGEGMDNGDKASNKAMSAAHKYLFLQVFCIPTVEAKDSENDNHDVIPAFKRPAPSGSMLMSENRSLEGAPRTPLAAGPQRVTNTTEDLGAWVMNVGKVHNGKRLDQIDIYELNNWHAYMTKKLNDDSNPAPNIVEAVKRTGLFLATRDKSMARG